MNAVLQNKLFISTRPEGQSDELKHLLETEGAALVEMPLIEIRQLKLNTEDKILVSNLDQFQWLILTSPNGVRCFFNILKELEITVLPENIQIAVIGRKTEKILNYFGYQAAFVNPGNTGEDFAAAFIQKIKDTQPKILFALGTLARTLIQDELSAFAQCTRINVYETVIPESFDKKALELIQNDQYEMLIFTSPSAIQNFMTINNNIPAENIRIACIGEVTAREAKKQGIPPLVVAEDASAKGIVQSIIQSYSNNF